MTATLELQLGRPSKGHLTGVMREQLLEKLESALGELLAEAGDRDAAPTPVLDIPRQKEHGDFATNVAMTLAKRLRAEGFTVVIHRPKLRGTDFCDEWCAEYQSRAVHHEAVAA